MPEQPDYAAMTDNELRRVCRSFRKGFLDGRSSLGMCFEVSSALQEFLSSIGVETTLVKHEDKFWNHAFLVLPDGRVLDATADQFRSSPCPALIPRLRLPMVYIGPPLVIHGASDAEARRAE
jgi:hypothetical protein